MPDEPVPPERSAVPDVRWHPPSPVLDVLELVLDGALPPLPQTLALLGDADLIGLAARIDPAHRPPDAAVDVGAVVLEDAEGTPVARWTAGGVRPARPFTHGPLRAHRRRPGDRSSGGEDLGPALVAVVRGLPATDEVAATIAEASTGGLAVLWLVVVGEGRGPLRAEAAWRAAASLVGRARSSGVRSTAVPVSVPLIDAAPADGPRDGDPDPLLAAVASSWARALGGGTRTLADAADAAFVHELARDGQVVDGRAVDGRARPRRGLTVFFTGLSGSGKSTIAKSLAARVAEEAGRHVTLLDGDEVRRTLSAGLGFGREDRDRNIRRIGFVAAEVSRHGGLAICAPIAPFAQGRAEVRAQVERAGGDLLLVYVSTPLAECERRDRKGLYARARRGEIPEFTGICSPYEAPDDAELCLDTTGEAVPTCVDRVWKLLVERGHLDDMGQPHTFE